MLDISSLAELGVALAATLTAVGAAVWAIARLFPSAQRERPPRPSRRP